MRVLFTTQPGSGHWRPLAPFAVALAAAGHEIAFATTPDFCAIITRHGFRCFPAGRDEVEVFPAPSGDPAETPAEPPQAPAVWRNLFAGTRAGHSLPDLLAICRAWRPRLIVRELSEFAGCVAAERLGIPHATVQVSAYRPHLHQVIEAPSTGCAAPSVSRRIRSLLCSTGTSC